MIKEINLRNIEVDGIKELILPGNGKIIKISVEFENTDGLLNLKISTKEGEEILDIFNQREKDVFYPRINIARDRYVKGETLNQEGLSSFEKFYFYFGLLLRAESQKKTIIKKVLILYEE